MRRAVWWLLAAVVATAAMVAVGVTVLGGSSDDEEPAAAPSFETTPLGAFDQGSVSVTRGPFCDSVDPRQVRAALGGDPAQSRSWANGDEVALGKGTADVAHEFGCQYDAADGTVARAWAFAPPVSAEQAAGLVTRAAKARGCSSADAPGFGAPGLDLSCTAGSGVASASYRGLFGDTWLVCEVLRPAGATWDVVDRAGRWCVGVLQAVDAAGR
jgi:hypothetical protein